ncbi:MAG: hypothetical protein OXH84_06760 [Gammaproteobacteria bacterium]|nr:hypothetical protein [Gammaproteobacteria bacterium]
MNIQELGNLLDRHGSDLNQWPDRQLRQQVQSYIAESAEAHELFSQVQYIDRLVPKALFVPQPTNVEAKVLNQISTVRQPNYNWYRHVSNWVLKPILAMIPLVIGFILGSDPNQDVLLVEEELTTERFEDPVNYLAMSDD